VTPTLLTTADCHLCEHAKTVLAELGLEYREVDADCDEGRQLAAVAPPLRPVLYDGEGTVLAYGRLSLKRLRRQIEQGKVLR
jgi:glutaredoxin